jgi:23S rRNA-/tRNA-specific pseudouridylate synthase
MNHTSSHSIPHEDLVVHVDDCIVVCNKPSGLLCVPGLYHKELNLLQYVYTTFGLSSINKEKGDEEEEVEWEGEKEEEKKEENQQQQQQELSASLSMSSDDGNRTQQECSEIKGEDNESTRLTTTRTTGMNDDTVSSNNRFNPPNRNIKDSKDDNIMTIENMVVHRLDMDTSGLVVFARNRQALLHLHAAFRTSTYLTHGSSTSTSSHSSQRPRKGLTRKERRKRKRDRAFLFKQNSSSSSMIVDRLDNMTESAKQQPREKEDDDDEEEGNGESKTILKTYEALLCGHFLWGLYHTQAQSTSSTTASTTTSSLPWGEIDFPLQRDYRYPPFMRVATPKSESKAKEVAEELIHMGWKKKIKKNAKPSKTQFRIKSWEYWQDHPVTRIELTPLTGRTHQLRVHCAAVGYPIVGDPAYGFAGEAGSHGGLDSIETLDHVYVCHPVDASSEHVQNRLTIPSAEVQTSIRKKVEEVGQVMCLHARDLTLKHPKSGEVMTFTVPPKF